MITGLEEILQARLDLLEQENLRRKLRRIESPQKPRAVAGGRELLNFSSNDYLGLATHPKLIEAAERALRNYGSGSGASRLICGSLQPHHALDEALADFKGTERALVFSSGYATALGAITALISAGDIIILDKLVHASIVDAARLSGAKMRVYAHNDLNDLAEILRWSQTQRGVDSKARVLVVTESLFSMDGDIAPLGDIVELKERFGAWLMVDEAHATGLFGANRRGLVEEFGLSARVEVQMGTLGKAVGSAGGYIAGASVLIEYLVNKARSFVFSTAPPPSVSAASKAGIEVVRSKEGEELLKRMRSNIRQFSAETGTPMAAENSPIMPFIAGAEEAAVGLAERLMEGGFLVPAIRYPTVARGKARLRITFSAAHSPAEVAEFARAVNAIKPGRMPVGGPD